MPVDGRAQQGNAQPGELAAIVWWRRAPGHSVDLTGLRIARHLSPVLSCGWGAEWDFFTVVHVSSLQALNHLGAALTQHGQEMTAVLGRQEQGPAQGMNVPRALWFAALWRWNDAWHRASAEERRAYDADVAHAFAWAHEHGVATLGRYACSWSSAWDHFTVWAVPSLRVLDECMHWLAAQRDWRFAQSHHFIGRPVPMEGAT